MFRIFTTDEFDRDYRKLDSSEQERVKKILRQLKERGDSVGKPLVGLSIFKEKKFNGKRIYFLVYSKLSIVLIVAISNKKAQQTTINKILSDIAYYQEHVLETLRKKGLF